MTTFPASSADHQLVERVATNLAHVRERVAATGADAQRVRVVAVTKGFALREVLAAREAGLATLGENYLEELIEKRALAPDGLTWHFLGALQSNKVARVLAVADVVGAVAREKEVEQIARRSPGHVIDVQVDVTGLAQRNGAAPERVPALVALARARHLSVRGLMTVAAPGDHGEAFRVTRALADDLELVERSMGMSDDFEQACRAGSTELRLGRVLFGPRPYGADLA